MNVINMSKKVDNSLSNTHSTKEGFTSEQNNKNQEIVIADKE